MDELIGAVERITFHNSETGFTVAKLAVDGKQDLVCVVGKMPLVQPGETVRCSGSWRNDASYGWQMAVEETKVEAPSTLLGIQRYLESGLIKGIGKTYAERIVKQFGHKTLEVIDQNPDCLLEVDGIGKGRLKKIKKCWGEQRSIREVMVFLQSYGVTPSYAQKIYKTYGDESLDKVRENPYRLAQDVIGTGFKTADRIAQQLGMEKDAPQRIVAGIEFVLSELSSNGHTCYPLNQYYEKAQEILEVGLPLVQEQVEGNKRIVVEPLDGEPHIWLKLLYMTEQGIARELERLKKSHCALRSVDTEKAVEWAEERMRMSLAPNQRDAVAQALSEKVQIITGGPGTGKSTITKAILAIPSKLTRKIVLAAPTGKAAKRMAEICRRPAQTIHSLLEYDFRTYGFKKGREDPIPCDLLIVDEASMIDTGLMFSLLKAIPSHARVIFVGDIDQLPSVGPGNVLKDLIASESLAVTTLNKIYRQAAGSRIITSAHRIREGEMPYLEAEEKSDFFFIEEEDPEILQKKLLQMVSQRIPRKYHFDPIRQIQVLAPMRRGVVGIEQLNEVLQQTLNPCEHPLFRAGRRYHPRDKVMQIRNNYDKEVFNGDVGFITHVDVNEQTVQVDFDGKVVDYEAGDLDELVPAYAVSVHKFQGSECPCVVMPVHTTHFKLLHRNLLYTGVTRGRKLVILMGMKKAVGIAVRNDEVHARHTGLQHWCQARQ